jgi:hypothetical protein
MAASTGLKMEHMRSKRPSSSNKHNRQAEEKMQLACPSFHAWVPFIHIHVIHTRYILDTYSDIPDRGEVTHENPVQDSSMSTSSHDTDF